MFKSHLSKSVLFLAALAVIAASARLPAGVAASPAKPSFTADQAAKGKAAYGANCAVCHGAHLEGISGPALTGKDTNLKRESARDVYAYASANMPVGNAGGLPAATYINLMAFLLQSNGHGAGSTKLTAATLKASSAKIGDVH